MRCILLFIGFFLAYSSAKGQSKKRKIDYQNLFAEVGGNGFLYSANYEAEKKIAPKASLHVRLGASYFKRDALSFAALPFTTSISIKDSKDKHAIIAGVGLYAAYYPFFNYVTPTALAGYRLNFISEKDRYFFQVAYTPFLYRNIDFGGTSVETSALKVWQWLGISLGKSF